MPHIVHDLTAARHTRPCHVSTARWTICDDLARPLRGADGGADDLPVLSALGAGENVSRHGKPKRQVFAVVRVDPEWLGVSTPGENAGEGLDGVTVQAVLPTAEDARGEARRLNELNGSKGCAYFWLATRYYPEGRKVTKARDE